MSYDTKVTCAECNGDGYFVRSDPHAWVDSHTETPPDPIETDCEHCNGSGECDCDECVNTAAENAFSDQCESEPPLSMDERHQMAWRQKQELRR